MKIYLDYDLFAHLHQGTESDLHTKVGELLEETSYLPDQGRQSRSRKHDVAHSIYASGCKQFITNDKRLYEKGKVTYKYLSTPTEVLTLGDFSSKGYA